LKLIKDIILIILINIGLIICIYSTVLIFNSNSKIKLLEKHNEKIESDLSRANKEIENLFYIKKENEAFENLTKKIVNSISSGDKEHGIGGLEDAPAYTNMETLEAILKEVNTRNSENWFENMGSFFENRKSHFEGIPDIWPIMRKDLGRITSGFGVRKSPITNRYHAHNGIDISADYGAPVLATADGVISGVWERHPTFGKIVYIEHDNRFETRYAHLSNMEVSYEQEVKKGDVVGYVGNTGDSDGVHLHYEIRKNDQPMDPVKFWLLYY
jgi:murein DD-endopeptidase MepM/ murein hydrolase activator NlpD